MNNAILLEQILKTYQSQNNMDTRSDDQIFELFTAHQVTKEMDISYSDLEASLVDGPSDGGVDSFLIIVGDQAISTIEEANEVLITRGTEIQVLIIQSKKSKKFVESALDKLYSTADAIFDLDSKESNLLPRFNVRLTEMILVMREVWSRGVIEGALINFTFIYSSLANDINVNAAFNAKVEQIKRLVRNRASTTKVVFNLLSAQELIQLYQKRISTKLSLRFKENPMAVEFAEGEYGYIGVVRLRDYYNLIVDESGELREFIFESNVRHYHGLVDVNAGIRDSLENDFSVDFWWLNNGVTIIVSGCTPFHKVLHLEDVQIVNGLQTSYVLGRHYNNASAQNDERSILVKVVVVDSQNKETIDKIISASNKQNPVTSTILRATDDIQRRLEIYFLSKGYYYDRRKNYYKNQGKPATKIFSIQYTAQAVEAILHFNPSEARSKPTSLIKADSTYKRIFDDRNDLQVYLVCCLIYQRVTELIKFALPSDKMNLAKNFSYHIARIVPTLSLKKAKPLASDVLALESVSIDIELVQSAFELLMRFVDDYQRTYPEQNIINIAKARAFSNEVNSRLEQMLTTSTDLIDTDS